MANPFGIGTFSEETFVDNLLAFNLCVQNDWTHLDYLLKHKFDKIAGQNDKIRLTMSSFVEMNRDDRQNFMSKFEDVEFYTIFHQMNEYFCNLELTGSDILAFHHALSKTVEDDCKKVIDNLAPSNPPN